MSPEQAEALFDDPRCDEAQCYNTFYEDCFHETSRVSARAPDGRFGRRGRGGNRGEFVWTPLLASEATDCSDGVRWFIVVGDICTCFSAAMLFSPLQCVPQLLLSICWLIGAVDRCVGRITACSPPKGVLSSLPLFCWLTVAACRGPLVIFYLPRLACQSFCRWSVNICVGGTVTFLR